MQAPDEQVSKLRRGYITMDGFAPAPDSGQFRQLNDSEVNASQRPAVRPPFTENKACDERRIKAKAIKFVDFMKNGDQPITDLEYAEGLACRTFLKLSSNANLLPPGFYPLAGTNDFLECFGLQIWAYKDNSQKTRFFGFGQKILGYGANNVTKESVNLFKSRAEVYRTPHSSSQLEASKAESETHAFLSKEVGDGIVKIIRIVDCEGQFGAFMEFCPDLNLKLALGDLNKESKLKFFQQILQTTQSVHEKGFTHVDLRAENILLFGDKAKISDFGLCFHVTKPSSNVCLLNLSPEVLRVIAPLGPHSDSWALGLIAYQLKFGCLPAFCSKQARSLDENEHLANDYCRQSELCLAFAVLIEEGIIELEELDPTNPFNQIILGLLDLNHETRLKIPEALKLLSQVSRKHLRV